MEETFVITARAEDVLRVTQRVLSLLTRNRIEVQELKVIGDDRFTLILRTEKVKVEHFMKQLEKLEGVFDVERG